MQPLDSGARHARGEPTVAIWRKSLKVRTPMGNRRALTVAAIKSATRVTRGDPASAAEPSRARGRTDQRATKSGVQKSNERYSALVRLRELKPWVGVEFSRRITGNRGLTVA